MWRIVQKGHLDVSHEPSSGPLAWWQVSSFQMRADGLSRTDMNGRVEGCVFLGDFHRWSKKHMHVPHCAPKYNPPQLICKFLYL